MISFDHCSTKSSSALELNFNDDLRSLTKNLHFSLEQMKMPPTKTPNSFVFEELADSFQIQSLNSQLDILHQFFLSCSSEDFSGPNLSTKISRANACFICQKNAFKQGPAVRCDYCPLIYHIHCLKKRRHSSLILTNKKWMCPNHLVRTKHHRPNDNRVRLIQRTARLAPNLIRQGFQKNQIGKIIPKISQIPLTIREFYSKTVVEEKPVEVSKVDEDSIVRETLQSILDRIDSNPFETIEYLIEQFNQPELSGPQMPIKPISISYSDLIDLSQFHQSHAALIHLRSKKVLYLRKQVIWFGSSSVNDISLEDLHFCSYVTDRHACLYYDQKCQRFELLNYSEYGLRVNNFSYGVSAISNEHDDTHRPSSVQKCFCSRDAFSRCSTWDGPAMVDQGTVIQIGCHEFLFYRHCVR